MTFVAQRLVFKDLRTDGDSDSLVSIWLDQEGPSCGRCRDPIPTELGSIAVFALDTGMLFIEEERPIHRCASLSRSDELLGLQAAHGAFDAVKP